MEQDLIKEINRIFHDAEADEYDLRHPEIMRGDRDWWDSLWHKYIHPLLQIRSFSVLDAGSGTGFVGSLFLKYLRKGDIFICYDISLNMLNKSREKLTSMQPVAKIGFLNGDAEKLPFADMSLDVVCVNALLHHLPNYRLLLKEIDRVLKKGGLFIVAHEHNQKFFKSVAFSFLAVLYKLIGGRIKISNSVCRKVNFKLREKGLIDKSISKEEIIGLVDFHSPIEQHDILIDKHKGFIPQDILRTYFGGYRVLELREYSTFFHRPFSERNTILFYLLKWLSSIVLLNKGPLFSFVVKK